MLESEKRESFFTLWNILLELVFLFSETCTSPDWENIFHIGQKIHFEEYKTLIFHLFKDHQCRLNPWNIIIWWHASYTSDQALINWLYLHHKKFRILILYFLHIVYENFLQYFINPVEFTCKTILWTWIFGKMLSKWETKYSEFSSRCTFWDTSWNFCSVFKVYSEYFQHRQHYISWTILKVKGHSRIKIQ